MPDLIFSLFQIAIIIFSIVIHEVSHGVMAYWLGDPTAKYAGRLTLNPIPHIDPVGSILVPLVLWLTNSHILFGWAKPVPYNPYNLRDQRYGPALVGLAGPGSNLLVAIFLGLIMRVLIASSLNGLAFQMFLMVLGTAVFINILLAIFNLVPIPPLDGSKILYALLPDSAYRFKVFFEQWGIFLLLVFIFAFSGIILPIVGFLYGVITGMAY